MLSLSAVESLLPIEGTYLESIERGSVNNSLSVEIAFYSQGHH